jgi:hypothetical protein
LDSNVSLLYNTDERTFGFQTAASYNRFFPALDLSFVDHERSLQFADYKDTWNEHTLYGGFHIPLNLSRGYYSTGLSVGAGLESITLHGSSFQPLNYRFRLRRERQSSARDLAPIWGQAMRFTYRESPWHDVYSANFLSADGRFAVPGLFRHHSLILEGGYERQNGSYYFSSEIRFVRGYRAITGRDFTKLSSNYTLPLFYPDWSIGQLANIKRVSGNVYYDYGKVGDTQYRSTGVELLFDVNLLHFPPTLRAGVQYAYLLDYRSSRVQPFIQFGW